MMLWPVCQSRSFKSHCPQGMVAHRRLHDVAGILHRDISIRNILINPDDIEGDRGILIDFDHAIRVGDISPYSTKTKIVFLGLSVSNTT